MLSNTGHLLTMNRSILFNYTCKLDFMILDLPQGRVNLSNGSL